MNTLPTVSIVTPSYNQAQYLESTILSVQAQRDQIHEYFVLDGGSNDGSRDIIEKHAAGIDYWVSERDRGQGDAIHRGLSRATGDILFWINSDDMIAPGAIARVRRAFAEHPDWDVLTGYSVFLDEHDAVTKANCIGGESQFWLGMGILHVCQQTCYFKRSLYERVGGIDTTLHCMLDTELWLRFFKAGARWGHLKTVLGAFRQHALMKGKTWGEEYTAEKRVVRERFPHFDAERRGMNAGRILYGAYKTVSFSRRRKMLAEQLAGCRLSDLPPARLDLS
jgi:glycosyltransferase involved in cell wall biosynthesis